MKQNEYTVTFTGTLFVLLLSALFAVAGCVDRNPKIVSVDNREVAALSAEDIVRVMLRGGFTNEQILELGTELRNKLAFSGAAQINEGDKVQAILAVNNGYVYVSSRQRGSFIYDLRKKPVRLSRQDTTIIESLDTP